MTVIVVLPFPVNYIVSFLFVFDQVHFLLDLGQYNLHKLCVLCCMLRNWHNVHSQYISYVWLVGYVKRYEKRIFH